MRHVLHCGILCSFWATVSSTPLFSLSCLIMDFAPKFAEYFCNFECEGKGLQHGGYCSKQFDRPQCFCHYKPRTMAWDVLQHPGRIPAASRSIQDLKAPFRWPAVSSEKFVKPEIPEKSKIPEQIRKPNYFTRPQKIEEKSRGRTDNPEDPESPETTTETYLVRLNNDVPMMLPYSARSRKIDNTNALRDENTQEW
ncbi:unnamed protein product, partial [Mesorhabditis spiculigera]